MKALVMWGAGSLGAAQVGMLRALSDHHIQADLVVGASVGALNSAYYATRPDAEGVAELAELWLSLGRHDVYPRNLADMARIWARCLPRHPLRGALRAEGALNYAFPVNPLTIEAVVTGHRDHLFDNLALARFLEDALPIDRLESTKIPLTVLAADARNSGPVLLSAGPALPALLASMAIPGLYPLVRPEFGLARYRHPAGLARGLPRQPGHRPPGVGAVR
ncbi:patatin-like phospholipase family protein [Sphaerisporangium perillae]|uniref:patatin-like phospholipase family protein n=1 Tax=Sphaerisporangium perillae TaxID=2935860 RepID=UPI0020102FFB|nr:patatin-like phospholipase family protein [Sphaerisporangium perillae]